MKEQLCSSYKDKVKEIQSHKFTYPNQPEKGGEERYL